MPRPWPSRRRICKARACRTARDEQLQKRARAKSATEAERRDADMAKLYRQHVLKEPALLEIQGLSRGRPAPTAGAGGAS